MDKEHIQLRQLIDDVEEALVESETKFRLLFEQSPDPVFLMEDGKITDCNDAAVSILDCPDKKMLLGIALADVSPAMQPDGQSSVEKEKQFLALIGEKGHARYEWVYKTFGGREIWADVSLTLVPVSGRLTSHVVWHDITDKKRAEENLKQANEKYRSIFENAVNGIFQITPEGCFISANLALARMYGFDTPEEMVETVSNIENLYVNPRERTRLKELMEENGFVEKYEVEFYKKDRNRVWISVSARAVRQADGKILYHEGFVEDITKRKEVEYALFKEKETLLTILNNNPMGVILTNRNGVFLYVNQEFINITGYTHQDVPTGRDWFRKAYPDPQYRRGALDFWRNRVMSESREWADEEFTIRCKDGHAKDIEFRSILLKDYIITVLKDVTKRKQAERALQESEEKFRLLFEKSADPIFLLTKGRIIDCNESALALMHCSNKEQLIGLSPSDISPEVQPDGMRSAEKARKIVKIALKQGMDHFEWMLRRLDGDEVLVDGSFTLIRLADKPTLFTVWRDITERRRSEDALRQAEEKYRKIFENATEGIFQTTVGGRVISANTAFAGLFGYDSVEEMISSINDVAYDIYVDPKRRDDLKRLLGEEGFVKNFEVKCRKRDGNVIWISTNMKVVRDGSGNILYYEGTMTDITERKNIQEELERKSRSLEDANAALNVLLKHREQDNRELEEKVVSNIKELVLPYVDRLKAQSYHTDKAIVDIIESNLGEITSPFVKRMAARYESFTPKEIRIADLIKKGKTTKEMSALLGLSTRTIDIHRYNIRRKLNLNKKRVNLQSYLSSLTG